MRSEVMEKQIGGEHYNEHMGLQVWDIVDEYRLNFYEASALKYLLRDKVDRVEDLEKAIHYLEKEIENIKTFDGEYSALLEDDEHQENMDKVYGNTQSIETTDEGDIFIDGEYFGTGVITFKLHGEEK